jgi:hypothetical protein
MLDRHHVICQRFTDMFTPRGLKGPKSATRLLRRNRAGRRGELFPETPRGLNWGPDSRWHRYIPTAGFARMSPDQFQKSLLVV